jgi:hypothetical protein
MGVRKLAAISISLGVKIVLTRVGGKDRLVQRKSRLRPTPTPTMRAILDIEPE